MKNNVTIRMGASKFTADVRVGDKVVPFNLRTMDKAGRHEFTKTLVRSFREAGLVQQKSA